MQKWELRAMDKLLKRKKSRQDIEVLHFFRLDTAFVIIATYSNKSNVVFEVVRFLSNHEQVLAKSVAFLNSITEIVGITVDRTFERSVDVDIWRALLTQFIIFSKNSNAKEIFGRFKLQSLSDEAILEFKKFNFDIVISKTDVIVTLRLV